MNLCECGCGQETTFYKWTKHSIGARKGEPAKFLKGHHNSKHDLRSVDLYGNKICARCETSKQLVPEFWYRSASTATGFSTYCKPCTNAKNKNHILAKGSYPKALSARRQALIDGKSKYDGKICPNCGTSERYIKDFKCVKCTRERSASTYHNKGGENSWTRYQKTDKCLDAELLRKYGISLKDYKDLLIKQNYLCPICNRSQEQATKRFAVDHNHKTGKVRGLLCDLCNRALGMFKDDTSIFSRAIDYLNENN